MHSRDPLTAPPSPRNIATIAVFYALPVIQLVITYQTVSVARGSSLGSLGAAVPNRAPQHGGDVPGSPL